LRAPQGLLISTTTRSSVAGGLGVASTQMDTLEARGQLKGAQSLTDALQEASSGSKAITSQQVKDTQAAQKLQLQRLDPKQKGSFKGQGITALNGQPTQKTQAGDRELDAAPETAVEKFGAPLIVAESPTSILVTSPANTAVYAAEQLHIVTQGDSHYAAAHTLSSISGKSSTLYSHEGGIEAVAGNGPLSIQAHTDKLELLADKEVTVVSVNDSISINAKTKVVMKAGQTSITLDGSNITFACPGTFSVKGAAHSLDSGASNAATLPTLPSKLISPKTEDILLEHKYHDDEGLKGAKYFAKLSNGETRTGTLDASGKATISGVPAGMTAEVTYGPAEFGFKPKGAKPNPTHDAKMSESKLSALVDKYAADLKDPTKT
jgi:type VI secretion system secreted protein VgrG